MKKQLTCNVCSGEMAPYTGPRHNTAMGWFLIIAGIFCTLFWIGAVLGIPLLIIGLYMTYAKRQLWVCQDCHIAIERIELTAENQNEKEPQQTKDWRNESDAKIQGLSDV